MDKILEAANQILATQPFSVLVGSKITAIEAGKVELSIPIREDLKQQHGFVHGGVISYAADNALTFAGGSALGPAVVTGEYKINYMRPAIGTMLIARAALIYAGTTQAVSRCDIYMLRDGVEVLCATAQGTITRMGSGKAE
jgi:uncharacterized protein (TIGR00369 family)